MLLVWRPSLQSLPQGPKNTKHTLRMFSGWGFLECGWEGGQSSRIFLAKDSPRCPCPFLVRRQTCLGTLPPTAEIWVTNFHKQTTERKTSSPTITRDRCDKGHSRKPQTSQEPVPNCHTQDMKELKTTSIPAEPSAASGGSLYAFLPPPPPHPPRVTGHNSCAYYNHDHMLNGP